MIIPYSSKIQNGCQVAPKWLTGHRKGCTPRSLGTNDIASQLPEGQLTATLNPCAKGTYRVVPNVVASCPPEQQATTCANSITFRPGLHKTGIRGIQDTRQIVDSKTNDKENIDKKRWVQISNIRQLIKRAI